MKTRTFIQDRWPLLVSLAISIPMVLLLTLGLGREWKTGNALAVLSTYLMAVLLLMGLLIVAFKVYLWIQQLRRNRSEDLDDGALQVAADPGPAMKSPNPPPEVDTFSLSASLPFQKRLSLSRSFRRSPACPRRRI
ncbi:MAG: hypothetical protein GXP48_10125 [Acidobacteria bacterium]|nr:hypothetical protein [Acidobacteriota bacterium]